MTTKRERFLAELNADDENVNQPDPATAADPAPQPEPDPAPAAEDNDDEGNPGPQAGTVTDPPTDDGVKEDSISSADPDDHADPKPARQIPDDKFERAEFSFRRQLGRTKEKYEKELKDRDEKYEKLLKEVEELKKSATPKKELRRDQFDNDEDFIKALQEEAVRKAFAERDEADAKKAAEQAEAEKQRKAEEEQIREQQERWLGNVDRAFNGDAARRDAFIKKVQYANSKGMGGLLDACPVAADYLMNNPAGPVVFEKVLNDRATFERVFNESMTSPLDIYYELRQVEGELRNAASPSPAPAPAPKMPHLGKPGKQAGSGQAPNIWDDDKAFKAFMRSRRR